MSKSKNKKNKYIFKNCPVCEQSLTGNESACPNCGLLTSKMGEIQQKLINKTQTDSVENESSKSKNEKNLKKENNKSEKIKKEQNQDDVKNKSKKIEIPDEYNTLYVRISMFMCNNGFIVSLIRIMAIISTIFYFVLHIFVSDINLETISKTIYYIFAIAYCFLTFISNWQFSNLWLKRAIIKKNLLKILDMFVIGL